MTDYDLMLPSRGSRALTAAERLALGSMPEPNSGCWIWLGNDVARYGTIMVEGSPVRAHRFSYEHHKGPIPAGLLVCHRCDTPKCVNPDHLFLGTHKDNMADRRKKGRTARGPKLAHPRAFGEANGNRRLTTKQVVEIRELDLPQRIIASRYGVSQAAIWGIKNGRVRNHG